MIFIYFLFCLTRSVLQKLKNTIFEIPIITQTSNILKQRTTKAKSINLDIIRKFINHSLKKVLLKAMFITLTGFEILLYFRCNFGGLSCLNFIERIFANKTNINQSTTKTYKLASKIFLSNFYNFLRYTLKCFRYKLTDLQHTEQSILICLKTSTLTFQFQPFQFNLENQL